MPALIRIVSEKVYTNKSFGNNDLDSYASYRVGKMLPVLIVIGIVVGLGIVIPLKLSLKKRKQQNKPQKRDENTE